MKDFFIDGDKQTPSVHFTTALYYTSTGLQNQMQRFPYNLFRPGLLLHAAQASLSAGKAEFFATRIPVIAAAVLPCVLFAAGCLSRKMLCSSNITHQTLLSIILAVRSWGASCIPVGHYRHAAREQRALRQGIRMTIWNDYLKFFKVRRAYEHKNSY